MCLIFIKSQKCTWYKDVFDTILHWKRGKCKPKSSLYNLKGFPLCLCHTSYKARAKAISYDLINKTVIGNRLSVLFFKLYLCKKCKLDKEAFCVAKFFQKNHSYAMAEKCEWNGQKLCLVTSHRPVWHVFWWISIVTVDDLSK